ncbi:hypothetical protein K402DRAFT_61654 [Aulographum hederae CBS 113979]|uniref:Uncharacterized protein n=1 Tax=Aulographum hederae CBS 113979 TaxID=1176131 RepID=A0A6G1H1U8_9PEZI|nr:hypothetical protein K402DRAFT_61654 [Aulographum hederae CBS 113979]
MRGSGNQGITSWRYKACHKREARHKLDRKVTPEGHNLRRDAAADSNFPSLGCLGMEEMLLWKHFHRITSNTKERNKICGKRNEPSNRAQAYVVKLGAVEAGLRAIVAWPIPAQNRPHFLYNRRGSWLSLHSSASQPSVQHSLKLEVSDNLYLALYTSSGRHVYHYN